MNPIIRTGLGVVDDKTSRVVLASDAPNLTINGIEYDAIDANYYYETDLIRSIAYRKNGQVVEYLVFTYENDPFPTNGSKLLFIFRFDTPPLGSVVPTNSPDDDIYTAGGGIGVPEGP